MQFEYPQQISVTVLSSEQLAAVYKTLAETMPHELPEYHWSRQNSANLGNVSQVDNPVSTTAEVSISSPDQEAEATGSDEPETDSNGVPFDPELHTGTKNKDGSWRVRKGKAEEAAVLVEEVAEEPAPEPEPEEPEEDDEFAAFKEAAKESETPAEVPERTWTDADLGQLCNDAAVKLGDPAPIKALIAEFVPEGEVAHSRNIPNDQREAFAQKVEAAAGIEYAG